MGLPSKKIYTVVTNICRYLLAPVFVVSGFVKAVDPVDSMYKLREYAEAFSLGTLSDDWLLLFALLQAVAEFLLGVFLLMGVYRKFVAFASAVLMLFFTLLTAVVYVDGSVSDCGCFGAAATLSNGATLAKNIVMLLLAIVVMLGRGRFVCNISSRCRWMVALFALFYIFTVEIIGLSHLPVVDFSPYSTWADLRALTQGVPDEYRVYYNYERNGETVELPEGEQPDSTWVCVSSRSELVSKGVTPLIGDFSIIDWENDCDAAEEILSDSGYVCIVAIESVETASVSRVDKINDLYDYCLENGVPFYVTTSSDDEELALWRKRTGAEYPIYWTDGMVIRRMIRSNPGMLLLKDGVIVGKWNVADIPAVEEFEFSPTGMPDKISGLIEIMRGWLFWGVLFVVPLLFIAIVDVVASRSAKCTIKVQLKPEKRE